MSEKQPALKNLPPVPAWVVYAGLALAGLGGSTGTATTLVSLFQPPPDVSAEVQKLRKDVDATAEAMDLLNRSFNGHVAQDAARAVEIDDHERRILRLEETQRTVVRRLDQIRVNQLVICRALDAPCGSD